MNLAEPCLDRETCLLDLPRGTYDRYRKDGLFSPVVDVGRGGSAVRKTFCTLDAIRLRGIRIMLALGANSQTVKHVFDPGGKLDQFLAEPERQRQGVVWIWHPAQGDGSSSVIESNRGELPGFGIGDRNRYAGLPAFAQLDPRILVESVISELESLIRLSAGGTNETR